MAAIITRTAVIGRSDLVKIRREIRIGVEIGRATTRAEVADGQIPAHPVGFAQIIAVVNSFDGALNQVMVMIVGVGAGIAGVAQLHLQRGVYGGASPRNSQERRRTNQE